MAFLLDQSVLIFLWYLAILLYRYCSQWAQQPAVSYKNLYVSHQIIGSKDLTKENNNELPHTQRPYSNKIIS